MRIRKYDFDYSRRKMMANVAAGVGGGVLAPVWPTIAATGEVTKAYPDEVTSIEVNTKGKVKGRRHDHCRQRRIRQASA